MNIAGILATALEGRRWIVWAGTDENRQLGDITVDDVMVEGGGVLVLHGPGSYLRVVMTPDIRFVEVVADIPALGKTTDAPLAALDPSRSAGSMREAKGRQTKDRK